MADLSLQNGEEISRSVCCRWAARAASRRAGLDDDADRDRSFAVRLSAVQLLYFVISSDGAFLPKDLPKFELSGPDTIILLLSSVAVWWGERARALAAGVDCRSGCLAASCLAPSS